MGRYNESVLQLITNRCNISHIIWNTLVLCTHNNITKREGLICHKCNETHCVFSFLQLFSLLISIYDAWVEIWTIPKYFSKSNGGIVTLSHNSKGRYMNGK